jgi:hypothetical protein
MPRIAGTGGHPAWVAARQVPQVESTKRISRVFPASLLNCIRNVSLFERLVSDACVGAFILSLIAADIITPLPRFIREQTLESGFLSLPAACAGYLLIHQSFEKSKQELHQPTYLYPSIKMSRKDHFQKNTSFTDRQIQLDLISRSSIDAIHPRSSNSDAERSVSIQISCTGIAVM